MNLRWLALAALLVTPPTVILPQPSLAQDCDAEEIEEGCGYEPTEGALFEGFWILVAVQPLGEEDNPPYFMDRIADLVEPCGFTAFNDVPVKWQLPYDTGEQVGVVGAYSTRELAEKALSRVKDCVPDASIFEGYYSGE